MRSFLRFVLAMALGLALLWRGLEWYSDHLRSVSQPRPSAARPKAPKATPPTREAPLEPTPLPEPGSLELLALQDPDLETVREVTARLIETRPTPELEQAVDAALARPDVQSPPGQYVRTNLICLKSRFPSPRTLELVLETLPTDDHQYDLSLPPAIVCCVASLGEHAALDPERVREVLLRAALRQGSTRQAALSSLHKVLLPDLPESLRQRLTNAEGRNRVAAFEAALALGAAERDSSFLERALRDRDSGVRWSARDAILRTPGGAGARLLARALAANPADTAVFQAFREREAAEHDMTPALVALARDQTLTFAERKGALEILGPHGDPLSCEDDLLGLAHGPEAELRGPAEKALAQVERRARILERQP